MLKIQTDFWYIEQLRYSHASHNLIAVGTKRTGTDNRPKMVKAFDPRSNSSEPDQWLEFPPTSLITIDATGRQGAVCKRQYEDDYVYFFRWNHRTPTIGNHSIAVASESLNAIALCTNENKVSCLFEEMLELSELPSTEAVPYSSLKIWDVAREMVVKERSFFPSAAQLDYSADGRHLAHAADNGSQLVLTRFQDLYETVLSAGDAYRIAFSPMGTFLASGGKSTRCWETQTATLISRFRGQDEDIPDLAFSPDERFLAIARTDGPVEFWDFREPRLARSYCWDIGRPSAIAIAPDNLTCAVAGENGQIVVWDLDDV